jgi:TRAP-type uncharacterized transport system substrate-binding protein
LVDIIPAATYINPATMEAIVFHKTSEVMSITKKIYFVSPGKKALDRIKKQLGFPVPYITMPPGTIENQIEPITTHASRSAWAASKDLPEEAAYHFVKMLIQNAKKLPSYHVQGKLMTPSAMIYQWKPEEFHPGAIRAYKEAGLMK